MRRFVSASLLVLALLATPVAAQEVWSGKFGKDAAAVAKDESQQEQSPAVLPDKFSDKKMAPLDFNQSAPEAAKEPAKEPEKTPETQVDPDGVPTQAESIKPKGGLSAMRGSDKEQPGLRAGGLAGRVVTPAASDEPAAEPAPPPPCPAGQYRPSSIGECFDIPVETTETPCPEGQIRMSTGGECVPLPADGSSPHDHAAMPYDPELRCGDYQVQRRAEDGSFFCESSTLECPDFQVARPTPSGWRCEASTLTCTAPDVARPTPHGWMCESPTLECPEGTHAQAIPTGWSCEPGTAAPRAAAPEPAPAAPPAECPTQFTRAADGSCVPPEPCPTAGEARNRRGECVPLERVGDE